MAHTLEYAKSPNYHYYAKRAKVKFLNETMISLIEFELIIEKACHYCGKEGPNGIDRVNNQIGYIKENCVPCCKHCNYAKGDLSISDFNAWKKRFIMNQLKYILFGFLLRYKS
ncbi:MAG: hypothetical protein WCG08_14935 [Paludibacter sp.]